MVGELRVKSKMCHVGGGSAGSRMPWCARPCLCSCSCMVSCCTGGFRRWSCFWWVVFSFVEGLELSVDLFDLVLYVKLSVVFVWCQFFQEGLKFL